MLECKKKMAQSFSDLKVALEKGKGSMKEICPVFELSCQEFSRATAKVPPETMKQFLDLAGRLREEVEKGNAQAVFDRMEEIRKLKKSCHEKYKEKG
jgi:XXXCH domain-containing protein